MVTAKSPLGCSTSRTLRNSRSVRRNARSSSDRPRPSSEPAYVSSVRACPSRSSARFASATSSSSSGECAHHSDSRCDRISASSPNWSAYCATSASEEVAVAALTGSSPPPERDRTSDADTSYPPQDKRTAPSHPATKPKPPLPAPPRSTHPHRAAYTDPAHYAAPSPHP